jgi:hypothetical protein
LLRQKQINNPGSTLRCAIGLPQKKRFTKSIHDSGASPSYKRNTPLREIGAKNKAFGYSIAAVTLAVSPM